MRKLCALFLIICSTFIAKAQDFTLKNYTDHFSILQNGQGIKIIGNNITDNNGVYFLKANASSSYDTTNIFHLHGLNQTVLQHPYFSNGIKAFGNDTLYTTNILGNFTFIGGTFNIGALGSVRNGGILYADGTGFVNQALNFYFNSQRGGYVAIGDYAGAQNAASLSVNTSSHLGVQLPFMTQAQRQAISLGSGDNTALLVYQTDGDAGYYQLQAANDGSKWKRFLTTDDLVSGTGGGGSVTSSQISSALGYTPANDALVVHIAGSEAVTGNKTFSKDIAVNSINIGLGASGVSTNTAVGTGSLQANTSGNNNTTLGYQALQYNTSGSSNVAIGPAALNSNTNGAANVAVGGQALAANSSGATNTAIGNTSMSGNTSGSYNTAAGAASLRSNTTGTNNVALGVNTMYSNISGEENTAAGGSALASNTTGNGNTAIGYYALNSNTTKGYNTAVGINALQNNTSGFGNIGVGALALVNNSSGNYNISVGTYSMQQNTSGGTNTALGYYALQGNSTGNNNVAIGNQAMQGSTTGGNDVAIGNSAGQNIGSGTADVFIGNNAGYNSSGTGDVFIGNNAGFNESGSNKLYIANSTTSTPLVQGDFSANTLIINGKLSSTTAPVNPTDVVRLQELSTGANAVPKLTTSQKNAISSPAEGTVVYDLTLHQLSYYNGSDWRMAIVADINGNIVTTNKITTADGHDVIKTTGGNWIYFKYDDSGTMTKYTATVSFDGNGNATVTLN